MEQSPEQINLKFEKVPIKEGDILKLQIADGKTFFKNEFGFETEMIPEGAIIKTHSFSLHGAGGVGVGMPEIQGMMHYDNGIPTFYRQGPDKADEFLKDKFNLLKLWSGDVISIIKLPE